MKLRKLLLERGPLKLNKGVIQLLFWWTNMLLHLNLLWCFFVKFEWYFADLNFVQACEYISVNFVISNPFPVSLEHFNIGFLPTQKPHRVFFALEAHVAHPVVARPRTELWKELLHLECTVSTHWAVNLIFYAYVKSHKPAPLTIACEWQWWHAYADPLFCTLTVWYAVWRSFSLEKGFQGECVCKKNLNEQILKFVW